MNEDQLTNPINRATKELFGLDYLFPYQRLVISNILEAAQAAGATGSAAEEESDRECLGRQIVILPTGAGKSLCFQLPAMLMERPTLVIYPILGLMADQERRLSKEGFSPVLIRGGQNREEREAIWEQIRSKKSKFIIANPEVLLSPQVLPRLKELNIIHIVIDEAHCVSEWGETFRPSYLEISKIIEAAGSATGVPIVTAFTATAGSRVLDKIEKYIFNGSARRISGNPDRKNIFYSTKGCILKNLAVRDLILANKRPIIVFCSSRPGTESLARYLRNEMTEQGLAWKDDIRFYHAKLNREEKKLTEDWFFHSKDAVLTATCAYGLGIDKPDIRTVIHRDCPNNVEAYLQESGRAGRDGNLSKAILVWGEGEQASELLAYARDTEKCRREALLELLGYVGEKDSPGEECCDICSGYKEKNLREEISLLNFIRRNRRCYTINEAAKQLARAENIRWSEAEATEAINYLLKAGKIKKSLNPLFAKKLIPVPRSV